MKRNFLLFFAVALLFTVMGAYFGDRQLYADRLPAPAVRALFASSMPGLTMHGLNQQPQALAQWKGKVLLVNFWATWCAPCVQEIPALSALQTGTGNANMQIIGIGIDSAANMLEFSSKYKIRYPLYVAGITGARLLQAFGDQAGGLPFSVLIAPDGQIKRTYPGRLNMGEVMRDLASI